ncbi:MAG: CaiB/BaiF CoA-transferase family protein [Gammaproteobacteria bacterium]|nr:CaiB/BaiF CoA-transferase family protein [Gammaproteobacteria bacterium]
MYLFKDLKVLDVGTWIAGPVSTTILADFGADVIKVEAPRSGDPFRNLSLSPMMPYADVNYTWMMDARNKRSITLNLKNDRGKEILKQMVEECDVYVTNQPMRTRQNLGLTYEDLSPLNDKMIYASLTAYGEKGPESERKGFDAAAYWTRSGLADLVRFPGNPPSPPVPGMGDHPTAVALFGCIVMALYKRALTNKGGEVSTSLLANGYWANGCMGQAALVDGDFSVRRSQHPESQPWMRAYYLTNDNRQIQLHMVRYGFEQDVLLDLLGLSHLLEDPRYQSTWSRLENSRSFSEELQKVFIQKSSVEWLEILGKSGINVTRLATVEDMLNDEQALANDVLVDTPNDVDAPYLINSPLFGKDLDKVSPKRAPDMGEHTEQILRDLGYDTDSINDLYRVGAI